MSRTVAIERRNVPANPKPGFLVELQQKEKKKTNTSQLKKRFIIFFREKKTSETAGWVLGDIVENRSSRKKKFEHLGARLSFTVIS